MVATPRRFGRRSLVAGGIGGLAMAGFYVIVVRGASGSWEHLLTQVRQDWYLLLVILIGFTTQVALLVELRRRRRLYATALTAGSAGAGASAAGMIACCAHHLADLLPFLGATGAAAFLYDYRLLFVLLGVGMNAVGIFLGVRQLRRTPIPAPAPAPAELAPASTTPRTATDDDREAEECALA